MKEQVEKRLSEGEYNDFLSDTITALGPYLPEGARIRWISEEDRKLFNKYPDDTAIEDMKNSLEVVNRAEMNNLRYNNIVEGHNTENLLSDYQKVLTHTK